jgi:molybdate-binding protein
LQALSGRRTHVAGVHLVDGATGQANVVDVERHAGKKPVVLITLGAWEAGLVTARGNPRALRGASDLGRRGLRLVTREPGSGARRLFDKLLGEAGVVARAGFTFEARGHLEVAHAVALGAADAGIATRDAAIAFGLHFQPLSEERYDLCVAADELDDPRIARLFDVMTSAHFRRELSALGYDVGASGKRVAEIHAA